MIVVMVILVALLSAGAIALYLQVAENRSASLVKQTRESLFCAEAGLAVGREMLGEQYTLWQDMIDNDPSNDPPDYPIRRDIDGDNVIDFEVTVEDNDDELATTGQPNDPDVDQDLRVFIVSRCIRLDKTAPREVRELVEYSSQGAVYRNQQGQGQGNTNNAN
jgi:hypothetical protein